MKKIQRESNIELCRIVCMILIIIHHCIYHGNAINMEYCTNKMISIALMPGGKLCFDTFIAISMWFLVDSSFKAVRFVKLWTEVLFYSVLTTIAALLLGVKLGIIEITSAFFPISGGVQGYAQTYLAFYLIFPFLSKISKKLTKSQNIFIISVMFVFIFLCHMWDKCVSTEQSVYSRLGLFIFFYFLMLYLKRNPIALLQKKWFTVIVFLCSWLLIVIQSFFGTVILGFLVPGENSIVNMIGGISLFFFFKELRIKNSHIINVLGSTTLAVLLIHDGHYSRKLTWSLLGVEKWYYSDLFIIYVLLSAAGIYLICTAVDLLRKKYLEEFLLRSSKINALCSRIDKLLKDEAQNES